MPLHRPHSRTHTAIFNWVANLNFRDRRLLTLGMLGCTPERIASALNEPSVKAVEGRLRELGSQLVGLVDHRSLLDRVQ